jgi:plastocyanin
MRSETLLLAAVLALVVLRDDGAALAPTPTPALVAGSVLRGSVAPALVSTLTDAVVYVKEAPGTFAPPSEPETIEQRGRTFIPHVLPVLRGTRVVFPNRDVVRHNVFSPSRGNTFNFGIYLPGDTREVKLDVPGTVTLLCNIHEEMSGYVLVLQNPYFSRVDGAGNFAISGLPDRDYTLELWSAGQVRATKVARVRGGAATVTFP